MNDSNFVKTALHFGALSGIGIFIFYLILYFLEFNLFGGLSMAGIWIPIVFIVMAVRYHRDVNQSGFITYGQGLIMGIMTTLFSASLFGLAFYLFGVIFVPELLEAYKIQAAASMEEGKGMLSEAMYEKAMESIDLITIGSLSFSETFNKILGGVIISLVVAAIFRRKAKDQVNDWQ